MVWLYVFCLLRLSFETELHGLPSLVRLPLGYLCYGDAGRVPFHVLENHFASSMAR